MSEDRGAIQIEGGLRLAERGAIVWRADHRARYVDDCARSAAGDDIVAMRNGVGDEI